MVYGIYGSSGNKGDQAKFKSRLKLLTNVDWEFFPRHGKPHEEDCGGATQSRVLESLVQLDPKTVPPEASSGDCGRRLKVEIRLPRSRLRSKENMFSR